MSLKAEHYHSEGVSLSGTFGMYHLEHAPLTLDEAEALYDDLEKALVAAGRISNDVAWVDPEPRAGLNISGFGGGYLRLANYGDVGLRVTLANGTDHDIAPREVLPVVGNFLSTACIRRAPKVVDL